ncbi:MAG: Mur ligase domain-containing protein, partial [Gemmatimonadales bacterium]
MTRWTSARVREALGLPPGGDQRDFSRISTDTRALASGDLFVALAGERFEGHDYLTEAASAGATGAVVRNGTPPVTGL